MSKTWTPKPGGRAMWNGAMVMVAKLLPWGDVEVFRFAGKSRRVPPSDLTPPPELDVIEAAQEVDESHRVMIGAALGDALTSAGLRHHKAHVALRDAMARHDAATKGGTDEP